MRSSDLRRPMTKYPQPSEGTLHQWSLRHPAFRFVSPHTTRQYERFLWLMDLPPAQRWEAFLAKTEHLTAQTQACYWASHMSVMKAMGEAPTEADKKALKHLDDLATCRSSAACPPPFTTEHEEILSNMPPSPMRAALGISFHLGQRPSDVFQLRTANVTIASWDSEMIVIEVLEGKVVKTIGPYSIGARLTHWAARSLWSIVQQAPKGNVYLFSAANTENERVALTREAHVYLQEIDPILEVRSIRRGGLQRMAQAGVPLSQILLLSRHTTEAMLCRYLQNGKTARAELDALADAALA